MTETKDQTKKEKSETKNNETTAVEPVKHQGIKAKLDSAMTELQEQNPMASWKNLFLGVSVVLLVIVSSMIYFNKLAANAIVEDTTKKVETIKPNIKTNPTKEETKELPDTTISKNEETTVLDGEGLWNVAERVCGTGEKYVILAETNGLDPESSVNPGQKLLVKCD